MSPSKSKKIAPQKQQGTTPKVLLVQANSEAPSRLHLTLQRNGFEVIAKTAIKDALSCLIESNFAALICDLHLPAAGDGFTLLNAMRHMHPETVCIIMSDYAPLRESLSELLPQADEILVTPLPPVEIVGLLKDRLKVPTRRIVKPRESVATILERHGNATIKEWLQRVNQSKALSAVKISDADRKEYLPALLNDLVVRLRSVRVDEGDAKRSLAATAHGTARKQQGYTSAMLVEESRILQVCIFKTLRTNLNAVDLALVLTDVMTIADEVDSQLTQAMSRFSEQPTDGKHQQAMSA
jgi:DNA-binding response OmpR family regulator